MTLTGVGRTMTWPFFSLLVYDIRHRNFVDLCVASVDDGGKQRLRKGILCHEGHEGKERKAKKIIGSNGFCRLQFSKINFGRF